VRITRLRGKLETRTFLPLKKIKPRKTEIDSQKFAQHKIYRNYTAGGLKFLEREIIPNIVVCQRMIYKLRKKIFRARAETNLIIFRRKKMKLSLT